MRNRKVIVVIFAGHYCRKMGLPDKAVEHLLAAARTACRQVTKQLAASEAALCLMDEGGEGCLVRTLKLLKQEDVYEEPPASRGHIARYLHRLRIKSCSTFVILTMICQPVWASSCAERSGQYSTTRCYLKGLGLFNYQML
jgi:hypothetical protein